MIGCIIQARMGSSRLPGKVLKDVGNNNPVLYYVLDQLQHCKSLSNIVVATTTLEEDDQIVQFCNDKNIACFRGNPTDVLDRYYQCAKKYSFSTIVRMTSDKPLLDPELVDRVISFFNGNNYDYVTTFLTLTFPLGTEVEVFSFGALELAWKNAKLPSEREHVTPHFYKNPTLFKIFNIQNKENTSHYNWAVDREEDLILVRKIISQISTRPILIKNILDLFEHYPELATINQKVNLSEGVLKSEQEDKEFLQLKKNK